MIAVVTGASSGIGAATARRLAREPGARLVLVARREDRLRALSDEIGGATVVAADLTAADAPRRVAEVVEREHGRLDLLVNNAGAFSGGDFAEGGFEDVRRHMTINFDAVVRLTEALLPMLRRSAPSALVNVASVSARIGPPGAGAYAASKFALAGWSDALHVEERPRGVHVGLVLPGLSATEVFGTDGLRKRRRRFPPASPPENAAEVIVAAGLGRRAERWVPRSYWVLAAMRVLAPGLLRKLTGRMSPRGPRGGRATRSLRRLRRHLRVRRRLGALASRRR